MLVNILKYSCIKFTVVIYLRWFKNYFVTFLFSLKAKITIKSNKKKEVSIMDKKDKKITCVDCGAEFLFTVRDQEFYAEKGFTNEPKRCKACRDARKNKYNKGVLHYG